MNKQQQAVIDSYTKGYRVINGELFYKGKNVPLKNISGDGYYYQFKMRRLDKTSGTVPIHRLVAYQKYGDIIFMEGVEVRHLDSNSRNNLDSNISVGSCHKNRMDIAPEIRLRTAIYASSFVKKHNHDEIIRLHKNGKSYAKIMSELNIKSKGTISWIIRKSMSSKST